MVLAPEREAFLPLVTSARAGRFFVKCFFAAAAFFLELSGTKGLVSEDDDDDEEDVKRRLRVNILCSERKP